MDFSETFKYTGPTPCYSPDGQHVACCHEQRVVVREVNQLQMVRMVSCLDKVQRLAWCCNSKFLVCRLLNRAQVFSLADQDCGFLHSRSLKIDEGAAGIRNCLWSPDGSNLLVIADFQIRLSVYSMADSTVKVLRGPKLVDHGIAFSPDGQTLAYGERADCKEYIGLYSCKNWDIRRRIATTTQDLADLAWSPDGSCLVVIDTPLAYKVLVYSPEGECLASFSAYQDALGIKAMSWSPDGQILALGSYDQSLRILSANTQWRPAACLEHHSLWREEGGMVAYQEVEEATRKQPHHQQQPDRSRSRYIVGEFPFRIAAIKSPVDKPNPKLGIGSIAWSPDGAYFATQNDSMPQALFIWSAQTLEVTSVLVQIQPVRCYRWEPTSQRLVVCTGSSKLYLWSPNGASCVHIPIPDFYCQAVEWAGTGDALMLADRTSFCCAYMGMPAD